ncbi:MAG TPA: amino acid ABC transporter permease [Candidatus Limnocylindrales bacterium]|nr:amino acid ABC transporter permease [Candidatus Limnocylindrales bacterium]
MTTLVIGYLAWRLIPALLSWALVNAVWSPLNASKCRDAARQGACWAFIADKYRFILFGTYPADEHWRPALVIVLLLALYALNAWPIVPCARLLAAWIGGLGTIGLLMWGGLFGLTYVENERWGGLTLTLLLSTFGISLAFPLSILLALGRRSELPLIRWFSIGYIELIRGVPLISLLFMASVMLPLFLPAGVSLDKLLRAQLAMILFAAAYLAEVVRGGLQAIPRQQEEAALALGHGYWQRAWYITLPQALRIAIPPLVNTFIGFFKDTSLVVIIGLFDFLTTIKVSLSEPTWTGFGVEAYMFAAVGYFFFCYPMSRYSQRLERDPARGEGYRRWENFERVPETMKD